MDTKELIKPIFPIIKEASSHDLIRPIRYFYNRQQLDNKMQTQTNLLIKTANEFPASNNFFSPVSFANYLLKYQQFIKIHTVLHLYDYEFGHYKPLTTGLGDRFIRMITPESFQEKVNTNFIKETIYWLDTKVTKQASLNSLYYSSMHLNFIDGYLDVENNRFYQHNPNMVFTSYIPFTYDECCAANDTPFFDKWVREITDNDDSHQALLAQVFGYLLSEYRALKKMIIFFGPTNTGKSKWLNLLQHAIGDEFIKSISLHNLTTNFRTAELVGAKANICAEIDQRKISNIDLIKALLGNTDKINADVKGGKPIEFVNRAALVFSTNTLDGLNVADPGNALSSRMLIIPFKTVITPDREDNHFINKLLQELPSILYKFAIPGFRDLMCNNFRFTQAAALELRNTEQAKLDTALSFLERACVFHGEARIHTNNLYDVYMHFCNTNKLPALEKLKFKNLLGNLHYYLKNIAPLTYSEKFRYSGCNQNGYYGIGLKPDYQTVTLS